MSGKRLWADQVPVAGQQFEYAYDSIGNRKTAKLGGDASGANLQLNTYSANGLNQYTVRTNASVVDVLGAATATASVTVNGTAAYEKGEYFWRAVPVSNDSAPVYPVLSAVATEGANSATNSGRVYLGPVREDFTYDLDGNLTADSRWDYTWDAENRLKSLETRTNAVTAGVPRTRLEFGYDAEGRRCWKTVRSNWNGSSYSFNATSYFIHDSGINTGGGWNLLAEVEAPSEYDLEVSRSYVWGLDLTGNQETDGNIGGLLMVVDHTGASPVCHFTAYDGNGNITALVKTDQTTSATYEYGPFGEPLRMTGVFAKANPFRWSTHFTDEESGLVDYGHRLYSPSLGRWISRDPIEEGDLRNLYLFIGNSALLYVDPDGRSVFDWMRKLGEVGQRTYAVIALIGQLSGGDMKLPPHIITKVNEARQKQEELLKKGRKDTGGNRRPGGDDDPNPRRSLKSGARGIVMGLGLVALEAYSSVLNAAWASATGGQGDPALLSMFSNLRKGEQGFADLDAIDAALFQTGGVASEATIAVGVFLGAADAFGAGLSGGGTD